MDYINSYLQLSQIMAHFYWTVSKLNVPHERTAIADDSVDLDPKVLSWHRRNQNHFENPETNRKKDNLDEAIQTVYSAPNSFKNLHENDVSRRFHGAHENQSHVVCSQSGAISPIIYETTGCQWITSGLWKYAWRISMCEICMEITGVWNFAWRLPVYGIWMEIIGVWNLHGDYRHMKFAWRLLVCFR